MLKQLELLPLKEQLRLALTKMEHLQQVMLLEPKFIREQLFLKEKHSIDIYLGSQLSNQELGIKLHINLRMWHHTLIIKQQS